MHKLILTGIFEEEESTPYWGLIAETGIWPFKQAIVYKKLMLFHNIMNSEPERMALKVLENQINKKYSYCWYRELKENYNIDIEREKIKTRKKSE